MTRVLIVDDKEDNLYYLRVLLEANGCEVATSRHGGEALIQARKILPDLVISDLLMPVMDGYTLLRHWKSDADLRDRPFIVYTATYTDVEDEELAFELGADAFIRKPAEPDQFIAELRKARQSGVKPRTTGRDDTAVMESYSRLLIRKLEEKTLQLEQANRALQEDVAMRRAAEESLRASQAAMAVAQSIAHLGSWEMRLIKPDGSRDHALTWSDEMYRIAGYEPGEVEIDNEFFFQLVPGEDHALIREAFRATLKEGATYSIVHRLIRSDGEQRMIHAMAQLFRDTQSGLPTKMIGAAHDITDRLNADAEMLRTTRLLRAVADGTTDALFVKDTQGRYLLLNQSTSRLVGKKVEDVIGQDDTTIFEAEEARRVMENDRLVMSSGEASTEEEVLTAAGVTRTYLATKAPYRDEQGRILGVIGISRDISTRKRHERHLAVLSGLGQRLNSAASAGEAAEIITQVADELFGWDAATLDLYSEESQLMASVLSVDTISGKKTPCEPTYNESQPSPNAERVFKEGSRLILRHGGPDDELSLELFGDKERTSASLMFVPIRDGTQNIGLLSIQSYRKDAYSNADLQVLQLLADYCGGALNRIQTESLRQIADERFSLLARATNDALWDWNLVTDDLWWSGGLELLCGFSVNEVSPTIESWYELMHPEDRAEILHQVQQAIESGAESWSGEYRFRRKGGDYAFVFDRGHILRTADGKPVRMIGGMTDLTERKQAEEKLRVSEERFREMADNIGDIFYNYDPVNNRLLYANRAFERIWGRSLEMVYENPLSYLENIHPSDKALAEKALERQMAGEQTEAEFRVLREDGSVCWVRELAVAILDSAGKVERIVGTMRDVTERKLAEDRLTEQAALLDKAKDAILVRDLNHQILYWNRGAERLYGWCASEAVGQSVKTLLYEGSDAFMDATRVVLETGEWVGELQQFNRDGEALTIEGSWTLVCDDEGRPKAILAINTDISERKRLEQQVLRGQRMESIGTLAGGMAHDLNNLLAPILLSIDLLRLGEQNERRLGILNAMESSTRRGGELVRQVLSFARGVEGRKLAVRADELLYEIEKMARETFPKGIQVSSLVEPNLRELTGDPTQLHQVLLNLCVNARDAMPEGGHLILSAKNKDVDARYASMNPGAVAGAYVELRVEDSGIGMQPEVMERIFEPFFTTKDFGKGTGLGLSTTLAIVKSHGGFVRVNSKLAAGTRFRIFLPSRSGGASAATPDGKAELYQGAGELILVVEDEVDIRDVIKETLEAFGYQVIIACDGAEGVDLYAKQQASIAAVLTDMMMPSMDGPTMINAIKKINPQVRIVAASGLSNGGLAATSGVRHFLPKPFSASSLLKVLREILTES